MTKEMKLNDGAKCAVTSRAPRRNKGILQDYYPFNSADEFKNFYRAIADQETDLKNEAWCFLIEKNMYQEFLAWKEVNRAKMILTGILKGIRVR